MDKGADASAKAANVANTDVEEFPNWTADTPVSSTRREKIWIFKKGNLMHASDIVFYFIQFLNELGKY